MSKLAWGCVLGTGVISCSAACVMAWYGGSYPTAVVLGVLAVLGALIAASELEAKGPKS